MKVDFFIVGAPKAGTTSLYHYLDEHIEIEMSSQKEPNFFSDNYLQKQNMYYGKSRIDTFEKYHSLFEEDDNILKGDASVSYLFYENIANNIMSYNPEAKIIIILRNPIDRAFSHYLMDYKLGLISEDFEQIIKKKSQHKDLDLFFQQYIQVGEYARQISRYLDVFEKENIYVIDYDDFKDDTSGIISKVFIFLGVNKNFSPNLIEKHNTYSVPRNRMIRHLYSFVFFRKFLALILPDFLIKSISALLFSNDDKPDMPESIRNFLRNYFERDVKELSEILNKDFTKWIR